MSNLSELRRPMRKQPRGGLSPRFYWVVLIAVVLMIALQAIPMLHSRAAAEEDAKLNPPETQTGQTEANKTAAPAATESPATAEPEAAPQSKGPDPAPAAATEPQAKIASPSLVVALSPSAPATTTPEPPETAQDAPPTPELKSSAASDAISTGIQSETALGEREKASPAASTEFLVLTSSAAAATPIAPSHDSNALPPSAPQPAPTNTDVWRGVLRLLSALTRVDLTSPAIKAPLAPGEDAPPEAPFVDATAPMAIPEDEAETQAESSTTDSQPSPLSATESLPAATQPYSLNDEPRLILENPADSGGLVRYLVDGEIEALRPGESQQLRAGESKIIFHRGGNFGTAVEVLREGRYQFRATQNGWTLTR